MAESELAGLAPPPRITIDQWADQHRRLTQETARPGRWRSRPYQVEPMRSITDPAVEGSVCIWCTQGGKTEILLNVVGFHVHHDPAPMLLVRDTVDSAEEIGKGRIRAMFREEPLVSVAGTEKSRSSSSTILHRSGPGWDLAIVGANSPSGLAARPRRVLLFDEMGLYKASAGGQGDPAALAEKRVAEFPDARRAVITSPATKETDRSYDFWKKSDQRRWFVRCHACRREQYLKWSQVQCDKDDAGNAKPETARYSCEHCGTRWTDVQRWRASRKGRWKPTAPFRGWAGFHLPAMAVDGRRLQPMMEEHLEAKEKERAGDTELLQVFENTVLAEWWTAGAEQELDENALARRRGKPAWNLPKGAVVPEGGCVLTLGGDFQGNRFEYEVVAWGRGLESWSVRYDVIYGNVSQDPDLFDHLDGVLLQPYRHARGFDLYIRAAGLDTGGQKGHTQAVYEFCEPRLVNRWLPDGRRQHVFGLKGSGEVGRPVWPEGPSRTKRGQLRRRNLWVIGTNAAKGKVAALLAVSRPGPGYQHFPRDREDWYFEQLAGEHMTRPGRWEPREKGRAVEAWDCRQYAYAALVGARTKPFNVSLEAEIQHVERMTGGGSPDKPGKAPARRRRRGRGFEA